MSTLSSAPLGSTPETRRWTEHVLVAETWAALAIALMWIAVAVASVWGPDFVSNSGPGGSSTTIPSGILVAVCASIGTWAVAKHGFGRRDRE